MVNILSLESGVKEGYIKNGSICSSLFTFWVLDSYIDIWALELKKFPLARLSESSRKRQSIIYHCFRVDLSLNPSYQVKGQPAFDDEEVSW